MTIRYHSNPDDDRDPARSPSGPDDYSVSYAADAVAAFKVERWGEIAFDLDEEFLVEGVIPRKGVGLAYGASQSFKSFGTIHLGLKVARGHPWAGRQTTRASVVYLAAEGAAGLRKRKAGYVMAGRAPAEDVDFALISASPNLGTGKGDYDRLVASIEIANIKPGLIIIDTVAKVIGGGDENGAGMAQFLVNAEALARRFGCFVLAVHHTGWKDEAKGRPRGWSGLPAALDVQILCERAEGKMFATLTIQKLKDEPCGLRLIMQMTPVILGVSKSGREVSTLIVDDITGAPSPTKGEARTATTPPGQRLLNDIIVKAIHESGETVRPYPNDPPVRAVIDGVVRDRYYAAIAEKAGPDDKPEQLVERQRKAFTRAFNAMLGAKQLLACNIDRRRMLWVP